MKLATTAEFPKKTSASGNEGRIQFIVQRARKNIAKLNKPAVETINDPKELAQIDKERQQEMQERNGEIEKLEKASGKTTLAEAVRTAALKAGWK